MSKDIASNVIPELVLASGAQTASFNTSGVDAKDMHKIGIQLNFSAATLLNASNYFDLKVQESDDNSAWNDADGPEVESAQAVGRYALTYAGVKRYFRVAATAVGAPDATVEGFGLKVPEELPAAQ